jgi:hypothetical protein
VDLDQLVGKRVFNKHHWLEGVIERKVEVGVGYSFLFVSDTEDTRLHDGNSYDIKINRPKRCWYFREWWLEFFEPIEENEEELWV